MTTNAKNIEFLQKFDLTSIESKLYLTLLEIGPSTVLDLSKHAKIKRPTTHLNIENLIQKGLVTQTKKGNRRKIIAESPEKLSFLLEQKKWKLDKIEDFLPKFIKDVKDKIPEEKRDSKLDVRYFEGKTGVRSIYRDVLKSRELRSYVNISQIFKLFPENPQLFPKAAATGKFKIWKEIIEDSTISRKYLKAVKQKNYKYKFFPKKWNVSIFDYMIYDGKIGIITTGDVITGVVIVNKNVYQNAKILFDMMWDLLPKTKNS